eukprot:TRINITY_DN14376_c0_g1_i1.p1 TRINITY_DN14376_c0_g1~~TRINITY_DN14376_c0_g1_i1.p1  ORF type:complete len:244 (+),score=84.86 TRINITY_DN14376_c0_g1_i1:167-898(+)
MPSSNPPKETIYVNNLPDKLQKAELKQNLYMMFSQFGPVVDVVAMKTPRTRGQAFVIYRNVANATTALRALDGHDFFGKQMSIDFAKVRSESIEKLEGTFRKKNAKMRRREREEKEREHIKRIEGRETHAIADKKRAREGDDLQEDGDAAQKKLRSDLGTPSSKLLLSNFPCAVLSQPGALKTIFSPFSGLKDISVAPITDESEGATAHIEYETAAQAAVALGGIQGHKLTDEYSVQLRYAKN